MPELPAGTVTFLFTDVEGSTKLLHELGAAAYAEALGEHRRVMREAFGAHGGVEVDTQGDAFFVAFPTAPGALQAAADALRGLDPGPIRVRIGIHTGTPHLAAEGYVGIDVHRAARIAACGHGGQVLVSAATVPLVDVDGLRDLGEHRLKDLSAPERIYQLGDGDFPPLKSLHQTNLPIPATPFLGRDEELADVTALQSARRRLVTLTGPGGTGKTRLAMQAAAEFADASPGRVCWVPLASLRDPSLVARPSRRRWRRGTSLADHIGEKRLLLLIDNFEQVIDAADGSRRPSRRMPESRHACHEPGATAAPGRTRVSSAAARREDGVELFAARTHALQRTSQRRRRAGAVRRLDNLPLALELAAARTSASPGTVARTTRQRLDLFKGGAATPIRRQQTLRATIEWSYELLTPEEQRLFARLAVFVGGCRIEAAEAVCDADLDTLQSLIDKSLLRRGGDGRFWMLETIREFAAEQHRLTAEYDRCVAGTPSGTRSSVSACKSRCGTGIPMRRLV